jgi:hypothetical protein
VSARSNTAPAKVRARELRAAGARLRLAIAMQRDGTALMRENLRRRNPDAGEAELDALLQGWLRDRPLDAPGRRVPWPRRRHRAA